MSHEMQLAAQAAIEAIAKVLDKTKKSRIDAFCLGIDALGHAYLHALKTGIELGLFDANTALAYEEQKHASIDTQLMGMTKEAQND